MYADDDPRLSPLWIGRRAPFQAFQAAIGGLAGAYDIRDIRSDDPMTRVSVSVDDWHGQPIVAARRFPVAAFDDLLFAVQQVRDRRRDENQQSGWIDQINAERRAAVRDRWEARGTDMDEFRSGLRERFTEAARLTEQPDDVPDVTA
jgi:hypothetical protein